jgi:hypothetical protein
MSVILSEVMGVPLHRLGELIGHSRHGSLLPCGIQRKVFRSPRQRGKMGRESGLITNRRRREGIFVWFLKAASKGRILVVGEVRTVLEEKPGHKVAETTVYRISARHGRRIVVPRRRRPKADESSQEGLKNSKRT